MEKAAILIPFRIRRSLVLDNFASWLSRHRNILVYVLFGLIGCLIMSGGEDVVLFVLSITIYGFAAWTVLRHAGGFVLTPAILFFLFYTVFTYISGLELFLNNGQGVSYGGGERNYVFYAAVHGGIFTFALGVLLATLALEFSPRVELARFRHTPWRDEYNLRGDYFAVILIGAAALIMTLLYTQNRGFIPLLQILKEQGAANIYDLANVARAQFSRYGLGAGEYHFQGYFQQFYLIILPFVTLFVASRYLFYRRVLLLILWLALGILTSFFLAMSLQRWPLMFFIITNYVLYANYAGRIRISHALAFATLTLSLFGFLTYIRGIENFAVLVDWVLSRILDTNVDVLYSIFEMFPRHFPFFGGQAILADIKGILPGPDVGFTRWLFDALYRVYGNGTTPTIFWGELYADFGLPGVFVGSLFAGFIIQWLYIAFIRGQKDLLGLVVYAIITIALSGLAITNPTTVLFQLGVVTALLLVVTLRIVRWFFHVGPVPAHCVSKADPAV